MLRADVSAGNLQNLGHEGAPSISGYFTVKAEDRHRPNKRYRESQGLGQNLPASRALQNSDSGRGHLFGCAKQWTFSTDPCERPPLDI